MWLSATKHGKRKRSWKAIVAKSTKRRLNSTQWGGANSPSLLRTLRLFREHGPLAQISVAKKLGISPPAAFNHFEKLNREGLLVEVRRKASSNRGRPRVLWDLDKTRNFTVGFCFEPPVLLMGLCSFGDTVQLQEQHDLSDASCQVEVLDKMDSFMERCLEHIRGVRGVIRSVYVGQSGTVEDKSGVVVQSVNLPILEGLDVESHFKKVYDIPCFSYDHLYAFYQGESAHLPPDTTTTVIDWDLGLGVVTGCNERVYTMEHKASQIPRGIRDIGHMRIAKDGRACRCGRKGCLEAYTGGWAIIEQIGRPDLKKLEEVVARAEQGDPVVLDVMAEAMRILGRHVSWVVRFMGTERIVFTGPLSQVFPLVRHAFSEGLAEVLTTLEIRMLNPLASSDPVFRAILGSCHVARHLFFCPDDYLPQRGVPAQEA